MKIRKKHISGISQMDELMEKYYDGLTTIEEERLLHQFLMKRDLPERFIADKEIFCYFDHKKNKPTFRILPVIRWGAVAAVLLSVVFSLHVMTNMHESSYACIDGQKTTDLLKIKSSAMASLSDISGDVNEVDEGFKSVNNQDLMLQQLNVFTESDN